MTPRGLGWLGIVRLGLVQAALGAIVVLVTSTMNRVMVVELRLPAVLPGALVALQYFVQVLRPRLGHGSDRGARRTPWIVGGMAVLAGGAVLAACATALMGARPAAGIALAIVAFTLAGLGVGAAGTSLLTLLARRVDADRRAASATVVWLMMIAGIAVTATLAGHFLHPFSPARLLRVTGFVAVVALLGAAFAVWGVERDAEAEAAPATARFSSVLRHIWADPQARGFAVFVFLSMLAYSAQELIVEPFAGAVFKLDPGQTARLVGVQHAGVLAGMLAVAASGSLFGGRGLAMMRAWTIAGCLGSAMAVLALAAGGMIGAGFPLRAALGVLGAANGAFAVSAIGAMMGLAHAAGGGQAGARMGVWGAAQAVAFGLGGLLGAGASDVSRALFGSPVRAYAAVFVVEAALFAMAAVQAARVFAPARSDAPGFGRASLQGGD